MLQIKNVSKRYIVGDLIQNALNDVSLNFRDNEFVAIMGPSGSGKSTLLNIIGGLDRCDTGDLIINNVSTSNYKDSNWDTYRNHTIGFVYQSRNLISHQSILKNVELALIIGGVSKKKRKERALLALDEVNLKKQAHKKPGQLSGGQMQRVAIARALVNNPDILLIDEPTSALDENTSSQVMEQLKEVAKDRLVIMITHNPNLANDYANRIIRLQDGVVVSDSNPFIVGKTELKEKVVRSKKARMFYLDALFYSFSNLMSKKRRAFLTIFTGSLGIISIALIMSLLHGFQKYTDRIQKETLSTYPLTISSDFGDMASTILSMASEKKENNNKNESVIEKQYLTKMFSTIGTNDLKSFKTFVDDNKERIEKCTNQIRYSYSVVPQIYTIDTSDELVKLNPSPNLLYGGAFFEMADDVESIKNQYDLLKGRWPNKYDELILVLSEPNSMSDLFVYSLGLRDISELKTIIDEMTGDESSIKNDPLKFTYDDLMNIELKLIEATDTYRFNNKYYIYEDMKDDEEYMRSVYDKSIQLKIVGIVCPSDDVSSAMLSTGVYYTESLTQYVINQAANTPIVKNQLRNKDIDIFSLKHFNDENEEKTKIDFKDMISVDYDLIKDAIHINSNTTAFDVDRDDIENKISQYTMNMISSLTTDVTPAKTDFENTLKTLCKNYINDYINSYQVAGEIVFTTDNKTSFNSIFYLSSSFSGPVSSLANIYSIPTASISQLNSVYQLFTESILDATSLLYPISIPVTTLDVDVINSIVDGYVANVQSYSNYNDLVAPIISGMTVSGMSKVIGSNVEKITKTCLEPLDTLSDSLGKNDDMITIDSNKYIQAIKFDMNQDELSRVMSIVNSDTKEKTYKNNLISLGYQDREDPTSISFYFKDLESKEEFIDILNEYNDRLDNERKLSYSDISDILMSNVNTIVDNITFVLSCFTLILLLIPSFMIAIVTLISVSERKKEIGILRAMGASRKNISTIFSSETFIIGLLSGLLGIGITYLFIPLTNTLIHNATNSNEISAVLPVHSAIILIIATIILTMIAGMIPSRKAAKQNPVDALRSR